MTIIYIRLLKLELKTKSNRADGPHINLALTLTSDLGETSYHEPVALVLTLASTSGNQVETLQWSGKQTVQKFQILLKSYAVKTAEYRITLDAAADRKRKHDDARSHLPGFLTHWLKLSPMTARPILGLSSDLKQAEYFSHSVTRNFVMTKGKAVLHEETRESIVSHIWDAGLIFSALLASAHKRECPFSRALHETFSSAHIVLELGTGIGLAGITLAKCYPGLDVHLSDLPDARDLVNKNIAEQGNINAQFHALDWTAPLPHSISQLTPDVVLMTDVTYNESYHEALFDTLHTVTTNSSSIIFASKYRHIDEQPFIVKLKNSFKLKFSMTLDGKDYHERDPGETINLGDIELLILTVI